MEQGDQRAPAQPRADQVGSPVNAGQTILVANQTINVGGKVEWIQTLPIEKLQQFEHALTRASTRHSGRVQATLVAALGFWLVAFVLANISIRSNTEEVELLTRLAFAAFVPLPMAWWIWFLFADYRSRNREAAAAADRRWAEVTIEIALRQADERRLPLGVRAWRWLRRRSRRAPKLDGSRVDGRA